MVARFENQQNQATDYGYHPEHNPVCRIVQKAYGVCCGPCDGPCYAISCARYASEAAGNSRSDS